ncbi:hypothetical protein ASPCADRAFT_512947 [Aspergillus carbonarius ITEM 5010]|uniref:Uncharacterized protein n=1 Tax=Aspergillus carbonarius (strain ITEM 5010) TaxID=602072 RepID=A0A1R3RWB1_ASPC5|nr:hypothetical protein ASPCADRAFT_512947 [Aspergillus carbonarius ITEM 5010]
MSAYTRVKQPPDDDEKGYYPDETAEEEGFLIAQSRSVSARKYCWVQDHWRSITIHVFILSLNILLVLIYHVPWFKPEYVLYPDITTSPLQHAIEYRSQVFETLAIYRHDGTLNPHKTNAYNGPPRPELEEAWDKLMNNTNIRVTQDQLGEEFAAQDSIVELNDGSGYYVTVSAYHGLHCVQRLHHYIYAEHYYPGLSEFEAFMLRRHTEHCLDWLRQYVQCHPDLSLIPSHWMTDGPGPVAPDDGHRECVVWEKIEQWMAEHSFDPHDPGLLVHPIFANPSDMESSSSPFVSPEEPRLSSSSEDGYTYGKHPPKAKRWWQRQPFLSIFRTIVYLIAVWGFISLLSSTLPFTPKQEPTSHSSVTPDVYRPETLSPGLNICDCGTTINEALLLNCVYDSLATAWLPPHCRDAELTALFDKAGPEPNGEWSYYLDEDGTIPLTKDEIALLGETGGAEHEKPSRLSQPSEGHT